MVRLFIGRCQFFFVVLCGLSFCQLALADTAFTRVVGKAYDVKTGALLYRETHTLGKDGMRKVEYSEPDGEVFGHKDIDFTTSKIAPSFTQENDRNGEKIKVDANSKNITIHYQANREAKDKVAKLTYEQGMIIDAGFDAFIKEYWNSLINDTKMDVKFIVPSRQTAVDFVVARSLCKPGTAQGAQCFSMTPQAWWVKLLVDPIVVAYDPTNKRLLRFTGRGNVCNKNGDYPSVDIQYQYL